MIFLGRDLLEKHKDLSDCELDYCAHVRVVPDVTDVVTEFCEVSSCCSDWEDVFSAVLSQKKRGTLLYKYARRDEVRRLTRESASDGEKKDDTAHTSAKFELFL